MTTEKTIENTTEKTKTLTNKFAIACYGLSHHYKTSATKLEVLKSVELEVEHAEVVAILGPSGSGKSTLLHLLAGLEPTQAGKLYWSDLAIHTMKQNQIAKERGQRLGLIFQQHYLLEDLTVSDNVSLPGRIAGKVDKKRAIELLTAVGLEERKDYLPSKLSGGERQRVAVARALYAKPQVILADEPTGSLDRESAFKVYKILVDLAKKENTAIIIVTHDQELVASADKCYYLQAGQLQLQN